jgi:hypothetical protein
MVSEGQRTKEHRVEQAEHRGVGADAKAKDEHGDGREGRRPAGRAHGIARVLHQTVCPRHAPRVAMQFDGGVTTAERRQRAASSLLGCQATPHEVGDGQVDVRIELGAELAIDGIAAEER